MLKGILSIFQPKPVCAFCGCDLASGHWCYRAKLFAAMIVDAYETLSAQVPR
jgi:hypothetical protein